MTTYLKYHLLYSLFIASSIVMILFNQMTFFYKPKIIKTFKSEKTSDSFFIHQLMFLIYH